MPPKRQCSIYFLRCLLDGSKKYFLNKDVPYVYIEKLKGLTIKSVLSQVYSKPEVRAYLPDYDEFPEKFINREHLFGIVNKLDPTFFERAMANITAQLQPKQKAEQATMMVQPQLLDVIKKAHQMHSVRESRNTQRALTSMLTSGKKRKRHDRDRDEVHLGTQINIKRLHM